jgi:serine/threonine-protein kinase HipA
MNHTKKRILNLCLKKRQGITAAEIAVSLYVSQATAYRYLRDFKKARRVAPLARRGEYQLIHPQTHFQNVLFVYKKNQLVGYLNFDKGQHEFVYDTNYLCQPEALPVSPNMALTEALFSREKMFNVFERLIPEGLDRKILEKKAGTTNDFDLLPLLQQVYGDLQFSKTRLTNENDSHPIIYTDVKDDILGNHAFPNILNMEIHIDDNALFPESKELDKVAEHFTPTGLSGVQHKLSIVFDDNIIRQPREGEMAHYFMKPYSPQKANQGGDYWPHFAINEHLFMTFAKNELGFDVPSNGIVKHHADAEYHYLVKRYDRYQGNKFSYNEIAALIGLKYQTTSENMFKRIKKYLTKPLERLILLKYYFYSMLILHGDLHTKNLSVMTEDKKSRMSPLYDIATTAIYQNTEGYETHLPINGKRTKIRPKDFYVLVDLMKVNRKTFDKAALDILFNYTHKLPDYFDKLEKAFSDAMIYSISLADQMRKTHQARMKQLEKNGWYAQLGVPTCDVDYPIIQLTLFPERGKTRMPRG